MGIKVVCNYSKVLDGVAQYDIRIKDGIRTAFQLLVNSGLKHVVESLLASYNSPESYAYRNEVRAPWTRTGNLQRTVISSRANPRSAGFGLVAGIGDLSVMNRAAPYWEEIEKGTSKYVGVDFKGYWVDEQGRAYRNDLRRWGSDKWVNDMLGNKMTPKRPIMPHKFFEVGAERIGAEFLPTVKSIMDKVLK